MSNLRLKDHTWDAANVYDSALGKTQEQINAEVGTSLAGKQGTLVSGENIKTVNGASILGSGNIEIQGGGGSGVVVDDTLSIAGAAADAKKTGELKKALDSFSVVPMPSTGPKSVLTKGKYIKASTGVINNGAAYAATNQLIFGYNNIVAVQLKGDTYSFSVALYGEDGNIANGADFIEASDYITGFYYIPATAAKIGITFRRADGNNISDSDITAILEQFTMYAFSDRSLSLSGHAADSSMVGKYIDTLDGVLALTDNIEIPFYLNSNKYINEDGVMYNAAEYNCTNLIDVSAFSYLKYKRIGTTSTAESGLCMCFFDKDKAFITRQRAANNQTSNGYLSDLQGIAVPGNAKYAAFSCYADTDTYGEFQLFGGSKLTNYLHLPDAYTSVKDRHKLVETYNGVIALYDDLVSKYSGYVTKNTLEKNGFSLYEYVFSGKNYNSQNGQRSQNPEISKPEVLITAGVHGSEKSAVMSLFFLCKAMCEDDYILADVVNAIRLRVIPVVCPSGYDSDSRVNSNGVNINRNFDADWAETEEGRDYSGAAPADQVETQIVQEWLENHHDAAIYIDFHNSGYGNEISCLLGTQTSDSISAKKKYLLAINKIIPFWKKIRLMTDSGIIYAYTGGFNPGDTVTTGSTTNYAREQGLLSFTLETSINVMDSGRHSVKTIDVGTEVMANTLLGLKDLYSIT